MIEIVCVGERKPDQVDGNGIYYIPNGPGLDGIASKYNWAIENIVLKSDDDVICFRHDDFEFREQKDMIIGKIRRACKEGCGVIGLIGTIILESSCTWWEPNRFLNGDGFIIQGGLQEVVDKEGKPVLVEGKQMYRRIEYKMAGDLKQYSPGLHTYLTTLDGCCLFINRKLLEEGMRFDTNLKGYHFYDVDICLQSLSRGYKNATINILGKHESEGRPPADFDTYRKVCHDKWTARIDHWPITTLTKFHEPEVSNADGDGKGV
jgi:hypothetical protein